MSATTIGDDFLQYDEAQIDRELSALASFGLDRDRRIQQLLDAGKSAATTDVTGAEALSNSTVEADQQADKHDNGKNSSDTAVPNKQEVQQTGGN